MSKSIIHVWAVSILQNLKLKASRAFQSLGTLYPALITDAVDDKLIHGLNS